MATESYANRFTLARVSSLRISKSSKKVWTSSTVMPVTVISYRYVAMIGGGVGGPVSVKVCSKWCRLNKGWLGFQEMYSPSSVEYDTPYICFWYKEEAGAGQRVFTSQNVHVEPAEWRSQIEEGTMRLRNYMIGRDQNVNFVQLSLTDNELSWSETSVHVV